MSEWAREYRAWDPVRGRSIGRQERHGLTVEIIGLCEKTVLYPARYSTASHVGASHVGASPSRHSTGHRTFAKKKSITFFNLSTSKDPKFTRSRCTSGAPGRLGRAAGGARARARTRYKLYAWFFLQATSARELYFTAAMMTRLIGVMGSRWAGSLVCDSFFFQHAERPKPPARL